MDLRMIEERGIRLLVFDLDGTLLKEDKTISRRVEQALINANEAGITVMAATGRPLTAIPEIVLSIPGIRYVISANGANIYDLKEKKILYRANMTLEQVEKTTAFLDAFSIWYEVLIDGVSYVEQDKFNHMEQYARPESFDYLKRTRKPVEGLREFYRAHRDCLEKVCCFFIDPDLREKVEETFPMTDDLCGQRASIYNYEIADQASTKGNALRFISEYLHIPMEQICAFGDGMNDADLLCTAGIGVAMGNAFPELKAMADFVTLTNEEDGTAVVIEAILRGRQAV